MLWKSQSCDSSCYTLMFQNHCKRFGVWGTTPGIKLRMSATSIGYTNQILRSVWHSGDSPDYCNCVSISFWTDCPASLAAIYCCCCFHDLQEYIFLLLLLQWLNQPVRFTVLFWLWFYMLWTSYSSFLFWLLSCRTTQEKTGLPRKLFKKWLSNSWPWPYIITWSPRSLWS